MKGIITADLHLRADRPRCRLDEDWMETQRKALETVIKIAIEKLEKEISSVSGRLNNENFVSKAPDHVIAENKKGLEEAREKAEKIKQALERLASMQ